MNRMIYLLLFFASCNGDNTPRDRRGISDSNLYAGLSAPLPVHIGYGSGNYAQANIMSQFGNAGFDLGFNQIELDHRLKNVNGGYAINHYNYNSNQQKQNQLINLGDTVNHQITITRNIGVPVPQALPVQVNNVPVAVPHPVPFPVDRPYPVPVANPIPVAIDKPYPVQINNPVAYPINIPVSLPSPVISNQHTNPLPIQINLQLHTTPQNNQNSNEMKHQPNVVEPNQEKMQAKKPQINYQQPSVSVGSGSLGYTNLGNGRYALGSGSLGFNRPNQFPKKNMQNNRFKQEQFSAETEDDSFVPPGDIEVVPFVQNFDRNSKEDTGNIDFINSFGNGHNNLWK